MRMQDEHVAAGQRRGTILDDARRAIAVFDGERKAAFLHWAAHALELGFADGSFEHQPLGSAADAAVQGAYQCLARRRRLQAHRP
jgi:hypothetical protein